MPAAVSWQCHRLSQQHLDGSSTHHITQLDAVSHWHTKVWEYSSSGHTAKEKTYKRLIDVSSQEESTGCIKAMQCPKSHDTAIRRYSALSPGTQNNHGSHNVRALGHILLSLRSECKHSWTCNVTNWVGMHTLWACNVITGDIKDTPWASSSSASSSMSASSSSSSPGTWAGHIVHFCQRRSSKRNNVRFY